MDRWAHNTIVERNTTEYLRIKRTKYRKRQVYLTREPLCTLDAAQGNTDFFPAT